MFTYRGLQAAALTAVLATSAAAQASNSLSELARRSSLSLAFDQTRPQGELGRNIGFGYGISGAYLYRLDRAGVLSLRADLAGVQYGNEWKHVPFSETVGGRVQVNVRTTNYIIPISVGPQLALPVGPIRPYVNAGVGAQAFVTESAVEGIDNFTIASSTNQSDIALMWVAGGGIYVPMVPGLNRVQLDVGIQYVNGGRARYLAPGSIVDLPGGKISISSLESATRLVMLHIGARIGL